MKKQLLLFVMMLLSFPLTALADAVEIEGIYFNLIGKVKTAEVTKNPSYYSGDITIPETVKYDGEVYNVTSIGENAFYECKNLTSVSIPNSVTSIGISAFYLCKKLTSISIPNSVTSIGISAFANCEMLTSVTIPNGVTSIEPTIFSGCKKLETVTISNGVTSIGEGAFSYCGSLTSISIPDGVTSIGNSAFYQCSSLSSISIPNSIENIGKFAFSDCKALESFSIPNGVTSIKESVFGGCSSLTSISIPDGVTSIGNSAFYECKKLTSISIPNSVEGIGMKAFMYSGLTSVTIPNNVFTIESDAFGECKGLTTITIGTQVRYISWRAFGSCPELKDVFCYANDVPSTENSAFEGSYIEYASLHVPAESVISYKISEPWKNFKEIVTIDGEIPETKKCEKPTISYENGQLKFVCATDDVEFITEIMDADIKKHYDATISLTATYNISVYATKSGYENSDVVTATLCWIEQEPKTEGMDAGITQVPAKAVLIQTEAGAIRVQGADEGTAVSVYGVNGSQVGSSVCHHGSAIINTNFRHGDVVIVKIGQKSVKMLMK